MGTLKRIEAWERDHEREMESLLAACRQDDPEAWRRLLESVRTLALDLGRQSYHLSPEDAEDLAQLIQIRVLERLPQLRRPAAFPHWLRRLIHHLALDLIRSRHPVASLEHLLAWGGEPGCRHEAAEHYRRALLRVDIESALSRLPPRYCEPIRLHLLEGLPQEEVGQLLGRPRSTVATQIERGLARLRRLLCGLNMVSG